MGSLGAIFKQNWLFFRKRWIFDDFVGNRTSLLNFQSHDKNIYATARSALIGLMYNLFA